MRTPLRLLAILLAAISTASATDVTAIGAWTQNVTAADLAAGAGTDLAPLQSTAGTTVLNISNTLSSLLTWHLKARINPGTWNSNITIWVKRTSDGAGLGTISGGNSYVPLTSLNTEICSGLNDRSNISLQFKAIGLNRQVLPNTYNSSIIFTVQ